MADSIRRLTAPFERRLRALVTRGRVTLVDDSQGLQVLQVTALAGERLSRVQRVQNFGLSSHPPKGSTAVVLTVGGSRSHSIVIAVEDPQSRPENLEAGESMVYDQAGNFVHIKANEIHVKHASKVTVEAPEVELTGNLTVAGTITGGAVQTAAGVDLDGHTHPGDSGGTTGAAQ